MASGIVLRKRKNILPFFSSLLDVEMRHVVEILEKKDPVVLFKSLAVSDLNEMFRYFQVNFSDW